MRVSSELSPRSLHGGSNLKQPTTINHGIKSSANIRPPLDGLSKSSRKTRDLSHRSKGSQNEYSVQASNLLGKNSATRSMTNVQKLERKRSTKEESAISIQSKGLPPVD